MSSLGRIALRSVIFLGLSAPGSAAFCSADSSPSAPRHDFQFFVGYSPVSATLIGTTTDRRSFVAGFGYRYQCCRFGPVIIGPDLCPPTLSMVLRSHRLGSRRILAAATGYIHSLQTNEGIIASSDPIPINVTAATGLNFLIDVGGGEAHHQPRLQIPSHLQRILRVPSIREWTTISSMRDFRF